MKISAIVPTRDSNSNEIEKIREQLHPYFDEIIIAQDTGSKVYTRYDAILNAKNNIIYTQDDDCLIYNLNDLINNYEENLIVANYKYGRKKFYKKISEGRINLIGYGSIFDKDLVHNMLDFKKWLNDSILFNRECDRAFTFFNRIKFVKTEILEFPSSNSGMWTNPDHKRYLHQILYKLKEYENPNANDYNFIKRIRNDYRIKFSLSQEVRNFYSYTKT